jgi:plasmid stabilization system protein ParE
MESKYNYQFTQKAEADLDDVVLYIARELSNPKAASDFVNKLQEVIEEILAFPDSGALVVNDFLQDKEIRKKLVGNYILYYFSNFEEKTVYILRIVYGRRNMDEILRQLDLRDS